VESALPPTAAHCPAPTPPDARYSRGGLLHLDAAEPGRACDLRFCLHMRTGNGKRAAGIARSVDGMFASVPACALFYKNLACRSPAPKPRPAGSRVRNLTAECYLPIMKIILVPDTYASHYARVMACPG
jgi:hypothetical protein